MSQVRALLAAHSFRACSLVRLERSAHNRVAAGSNPARPMLATEALFAHFVRTQGSAYIHGITLIRSFDSCMAFDRSLRECLCALIHSHVPGCLARHDSLNPWSRASASLQREAKQGSFSSVLLLLSSRQRSSSQISPSSPPEPWPWH